jgi:hypothetical protein
MMCVCVCVRERERKKREREREKERESVVNEKTQMFTLIPDDDIFASLRRIRKETSWVKCAIRFNQIKCLF